MTDINDKKKSSIVEDSKTSAVMNIGTEFGRVGAGKYTAADPALTDGQFAFFRLTDKGYLKCSLADATVTIAGDIGVDVYAFTKYEDGTDSNSYVYKDGQNATGTTPYFQGVAGMTSSGTIKAISVSSTGEISVSLTSGTTGLASGGTLSDIKTSVQIMDDWDDGSDNCKVNIIAGTTGLASEGTLDSVKTAVELIDDTVYADQAGFTVGTSKFNAIGGIYESSESTLNTGSTGALALTNYRHLKVRADGYDVATDSQKVFEVAPLNTAYVNETVVNYTNQTTGTTYAYIDMDGYRYLSIQIETTGTMTTSLEATNEPSTALASCTYQDVTTALTGSASFTTDSFVFIDTDATPRAFRLKLNSAGTTASYQAYVKKFY